MKQRFTVFLAIQILLAGVAFAQSSQPAPTSQDAKMKWFREAKFGLFIHWGLYSIPAGEWKGQPVAGIGEWIMNRAKIPVQGVRAARHAVQSREVQRRRVGANGRRTPA